ncbi:kinesin-like protein KIN-7J isoform X2 [Gossypium hirsutum]|uniref:Kinesin-like protein n=1 Tax=Gossypium hirsutum TaxID=3635 RepID=A0ABM3A9E0_GOSHI|nr:kinesin-like protein KIN-7J isoform X2 [Gossypium hirsutum]
MIEDSEFQGPGEKIFVSVRIRPLNDKERKSDWECINNDTIIFKNSLPERSMFPAAYTFDRVYDCDCPTKQVYDEGAKHIALSVLNGINSSIFAYGQTSSGKTYTMRGITEYAVADIYDYIEKHKEREFVVKFSAMEIYNEAVRDLLSLDSTPLRLLDDPERGTVVERLAEETLRDKDHLEELLSICEAQRQIGETALNETSSRSHQILRLTIESSAREYAGAENSSILSASVNFVDLAGSERASQTLSAGTRLKEGCHINRSLLTLGTVIRKLSKGRNSHVPYRDSKLTRILQNALGGNARTAIICTMSPDRSHVEQSRNTLSFASCAKEMAKEIEELTRQRDLAQSRVENLLLSVREVQMLKSGEYSSNSSEVTNVPCTVDYSNHKDIVTPSVPITNNNNQYDGHPENSEEECHLDGITTKFVEPDPSKGWDKVAQKIDEKFEDNCKEVRCIEFEDSSIEMNEKEKVASLNPENNEGKPTVETNELWIDHVEDGKPATKEAVIKEIEADNLSADPEEEQGKVSLTETELSIEKQEGDDLSSNPKENVEDLRSSHVNKDETCEALKQKVQELQKTIKFLVRYHIMGDSPALLDAASSASSMSRSRSCKAIVTTMPSSPRFEKSQQNETVPTFTEAEKDFIERAKTLSQKLSNSKDDNRNEKMSRCNSQASITSGSTEEQSVKDIDVEETCSEVNFPPRPWKSFASGSKRRTSFSIDFSEGGCDTKTCQEKQIDKNLVPETKTENSQETNHSTKLHSSWPEEFENLQRTIIELWDKCNVPLIHRTYFILLFKGDPSDSVYMEVELRRLSFLKNSMSSLGINGWKDSPIDTAASSAKDLMRERRMLYKQIQKKFSKKQREELYKKWGIGLNTKQRSSQLARRLWTNTQDMGHVKESAALVAKLLGLVEPSQAPKEVVGLSILPRSVTRRSSSWKNVIPPLL